MTYSTQQLEAMLTDLESDLVERKESASDCSKIRKTICAFANDLAGHGQPGVIFLGADNDGSPADLAITDEIVQIVSQMRSNGDILPLPNLTVEKKTLRGHELLVVVVEPSDSPPVRYQGRVWVRIGSTLQLATPEEEQRLSERRRFRDLPFDYRPVEGATLNDLLLEFFRASYLPSAVSDEVLVQNQRSLEQQLRSLRFLSLENRPNYGAILTFGKDPLVYLPGAYIQFARFEGNSITDAIKDQKPLSGPLFEILPKLDDLLTIHVLTASNPGAAPVEIRVPDYPIIALQQLVRNAVMHRAYENAHTPVRVYWFDNRVEITNPGGLYGHVTRENLGSGATAYRNPLLAEAMRVLGYVQNFGMGIPLTNDALLKYGNPPVEFDIQPTFFRATLRRRP